MTLDEIVAAARSRAGDVDVAAYRYSKNEYVSIMADQARTLGVRKVATLDTFTFTLTPNQEAVAPIPDNTQGTILAVATALRVLEQTYRKRVDEGTLGVIWQSGMESESTLSAQQAYERVIGDVRLELESLKAMAISLTFAARKQ
jgi:hypothetical protein